MDSVKGCSESERSANRTGAAGIPTGKQRSESDQ